MYMFLSDTIGKTFAQALVQQGTRGHSRQGHLSIPSAPPPQIPCSGPPCAMLGCKSVNTARGTLEKTRRHLRPQPPQEPHCRWHHWIYRRHEPRRPMVLSTLYRKMPGATRRSNSLALPPTTWHYSFIDSWLYCTDEKLEAPPVNPEKNPTAAAAAWSLAVRDSAAENKSANCSPCISTRPPIGKNDHALFRATKTTEKIHAPCHPARRQNIPALA